MNYLTSALLVLLLGGIFTVSAFSRNVYRLLNFLHVDLIDFLKKTNSNRYDYLLGKYEEQRELIKYRLLTFVKAQPEIDIAFLEALESLLTDDESELDTNVTRSFGLTYAHKFFIHTEKEVCVWNSTDCGDIGSQYV